MVSEVQTAKTENQCLTFLAFQSGTHETQALGFHLVLCHVHETQAPGFHPVQALHYFIFMTLRPQVFHLCKHFTISLCMHFHETQAPGFQPVQECHHLVFMILSLMFSACACTSLLNFHESQAPVFSHCEQFLPSFSPIP